MTLYVAADNPEISSVVAAFDHKYAKGDVPPLTVMLIAPVLAPKQSTFVLTKPRVGARGSAFTTALADAKEEQLSEFLTVKV